MAFQLSSQLSYLFIFACNHHFSLEERNDAAFSRMPLKLLSFPESDKSSLQMLERKACVWWSISLIWVPLCIWAWRYTTPWSEFEFEIEFQFKFENEFNLNLSLNLNLNLNSTLQLDYVYMIPKMNLNEFETHFGIEFHFDVS